MRKNSATAVTLALALTLAAFLSLFAGDKEPPLVATPEGGAPSDAVVLFDGTDLAEWVDRKSGGPAGWTVENGVMTVKKGTIRTKREFGSMQIHLEFASPSPPNGEGQDRGNSGLYILGKYELQILDSYESKTYVNGMCGSMYKQHAPLANASRAPGLWQVYDIVFHAPGFDSAGNVIRSATITVFHNGVLIQDHTAIKPTGSQSGTAEVPRGPIVLQDHNHPVKFRNIWVREL